MQSRNQSSEIATKTAPNLIKGECEFGNGRITIAWPRPRTCHLSGKLSGDWCAWTRGASSSSESETPRSPASEPQRLLSTRASGELASLPLDIEEEEEEERLGLEMIGRDHVGGP